jgi:hypothetical protein
MTHPPLTGEEVKMTFRPFSPTYDIKDFKITMIFHKRNENEKNFSVIPAANIMVSTELQWNPDTLKNAVGKIDIQKNTTRELVSVIRFPEPGDWKIDIRGDFVRPDQGFVSVGDQIPLTVTDNKSYYGLKPRY